MTMTHEERAFRRGLQHGYQLAVTDVLAGASAQDMRLRDQAIQEWRNTGIDRFPPDMPRVRRHHHADLATIDP